MRASAQRALSAAWFVSRAPHVGRPPQPSHVGRLSANACALVPIVGSCCAGCAEGKGCAAKEELELLHAQERERVGDVPGFTEKALPWTKVEEFDAVVRKLDQAVRDKGNAGVQFLWLTEQIGYWPRWRAWFDATKESWWNLFGGLAITGPTLKQFEDFRNEYNVLVDKFKQAGLDAGLGPVDTTDKSPVQEGLEKGGEAAGEGAGAFGAALGASLGTLVWVGAAVVGLYFLGPPIVTALIARRRAA